MPGLTRPLPRLARLARLLAATALLAGLAVTTAAPSTARTADEQPVRLSAKPVDQPGKYFDLILLPGESRRLEIALGNHGDEPIAARTYAADAYTIYNGGFGAALRDTEATGTTTWLDYPSEVRTLQPDRAAVRTFTVTVPQGTPAGEYITSIVLENDVPIEGEGGVAIDQIVRQVVAVAVRVPGPLVPGLTIASGAHTVVAERSVVAVDVINTGNVRVTPSAELVLHDVTGAVVSQATVPMDSFYAGTDTKVEVTLDRVLQPGRYTVDLTLDDDERDAHAEARGLALTVAAPAREAGTEPSSVGRQITEVLRSAPEHLPVAAGVLVAVGVALVTGLALLAARRRRSKPV